jgi:hypothetical protein
MQTKLGPDSICVGHSSSGIGLERGCVLIPDVFMHLERVDRNCMYVLPGIDWPPLLKQRASERGDSAFVGPHCR